jgi:hypothetical protein
VGESLKTTASNVSESIKSTAAGAASNVAEKSQQIVSNLKEAHLGERLATLTSNTKDIIAGTAEATVEAVQDIIQRKPIHPHHDLAMNQNLPLRELAKDTTLQFYEGTGMMMQDIYESTVELSREAWEGASVLLRRRGWNDVQFAAWKRLLFGNPFLSLGLGLFFFSSFYFGLPAWTMGLGLFFLGFFFYFFRQ